MPLKSTDPTKPRGVSLRKSQWQEIEDIAESLGITRHAVASYFILRSLNEYKAGEFKLETTTQPKLDMPD